MINVKKNKKRVLWILEAEKSLLVIWQKYVEKLRSTRRTFSVYEEMAKELQKHGHDYTGGEVHIKIHNFTNRYKKDKRQIRASLITESTWVHYEAVDKILGNYKSVSSNYMDEDSILENLNGTYKFKPTVRKSPMRLKRPARGVKEVRENGNDLKQTDTGSEESNPTDPLAKSDIKAEENSDIEEDANSDDVNSVMSENMSSSSEDNAVNYMAETPSNKTAKSILENLAVEKAKKEIEILKKEHAQRLKLEKIEHTRKLEIMNREHELTVQKLKLEIELLKKNH